ncbi:hypothetical protein LLG95_02330 [bacterium]|nr:hypothetical protein [bacterium]
MIINTLNRQRIVASNLIVRDEGSDAVLSFHWIGLRRFRRQGAFIRDETAELNRRLCGIFPRLSYLRITIGEASHGRRWVRLVQFRVAMDELAYMVPQPVAERTCA